MIELYIERNLVQFKDDITIPFTYESIDPDKLSTIKNSFSKTIDIPGNLNNNKIFGDIFRVDRYIPSTQVYQYPWGAVNIGMQYDPHKKAEYQLINNGILINSGYCTLNDILIQDNDVITYKITLYGGIGNFFYNLSYKDTGENKTLYDLIWNWRSKDITYSYPLSPSQENTDVLYNCTPRNVAQSYSYLTPSEDIELDYQRQNPITGDWEWVHDGDPAWWNLEYDERYKITRIDRDVVFIPSYSGYYNDFDSKHMIYLTTDRGTAFSPRVFSIDTVNKLNESFPEYIDDTSESPTVRYSTIGKTLSSNDQFRYGLITVSRDLDSFEAGDLRINEMPVAIRFSKLMRTISEPWNNGGYTVKWDEEITNSPYWNYSWVMLGKLNQESNNDDYSSIDITKPSYDDTIRFMWRGKRPTQVYNVEMGAPYWSYWNQVITGRLYDAGEYIFKISTKPKITFESRFLLDRIKRHIDKYTFTSSAHYVNNFGSSFYRQNLFCLVHKIIYNDGEGTHNKYILDIFYITGDEVVSRYGDGLENTDTLTELIKRKIESFTNLGIDEEISQVVVHNIKPTLSDEYDNPDHYNRKFIDANFPSEVISTDINLSDSEPITDYFPIYIFQANLSVFADYRIRDDGEVEYGVGIWGYNNPPDVPVNIVPEEFFSFIDSDGDYNFFGIINDEMCQIDATFNENSARTGIYLKNTTGSNIIELTKSMLFANSDSPAKYLIDFCKMMNYRFVLDDLTKTIEIHTLDNYYKNNIKEIDDKVDLARDRNVKIINTKNKLIDFGLETPETYPVSLFNRISKDKFNLYHYNTGVEWNQDNTTLLNDLTYKNLIDWQQSSVFYNLKPQFPRPYITPTISWTLFNTETDSIQKKEIITPGYGMQVSTLTETVDYMPKISLFDRDNKYVDSSNNLIFLNGFIKNYDYTPSDYSEIQPDSIIENNYIDVNGNINNSTYQDIYVYNVIEGYKYCITCSYTSGYGSYVANYYDSNDVRIGTEYSQQSQTFNRAELTLPEGTTVIKINFRKADNDKKLESILYTISSRLSVSQDVAEQFYLNGSRCYMNDFSYSDNFVGWGRYSTRDYSADSWVLPYFSRDLYNQRVSDWGNQVISPVAVQDNYYFYISNGVYTTIPDPNWEIRIYYVGNIRNPKFWAEYLPQTNKNVLCKFNSSGDLLGVEGTISLNQYEFHSADINLLGGSVIEVRMNVYKPSPYSDNTYIKADVELNSKHWEASPQILASWNLVRQNNTRMYDLKNSVFVKNNNYSFQKQITDIESINDNEYKIESLQDIQNTVYESNWKNYMNDLYDRNSRDITCYIDLTEFGSPNDILRKIYFWQGFYWVITKIENFQYNQIGKDKFTKCTLHKVSKLYNWINEPGINYQSQTLTINNVWDNSRFEMVNGMLHIVGDPNWEMRSYLVDPDTMQNVRFWAQYPSDTTGVNVILGINGSSTVNEQYPIDSNNYNFYGSGINITGLTEIRMNVWKANTNTTYVKADVRI